MKRIFAPALVLAMSFSLGLLAQDLGQQQPPVTPEPSQPGQPTAKPPRVVGQPQSQEEITAWKAIEQATGFDQKAQLAEKFITQFPESGLTPFAHQLLALHYQQANNYEKFLFHGEKTLEDLPQNFLILSALAVAYAQKDQPDKAKDRAEKALQVLAVMPRPAAFTEGQWTVQKDQLSADSHYAIGSASITLYQKAPAAKAQEDPNLKKGVEELEQAVQLDPAHDRSYYYLGFAYAKLNKAEKSIESYARAVAIGSITQTMAREQLQRVYQFVYKNTDGIDQAIARQREYVQKKISERQALMAPPAAPAPAEPGQASQPTQPAPTQPAPTQPAPQQPQP